MPLPETVDDPVLGELWDGDELERHAARLALQSGSHPTAARRGITAQLDRNVRMLREANLGITEALSAGRAITPAAEWLVDNFHIIADQANSIRLGLTPAVWRTLPADDCPDADGWPRIYRLVLEYLSHSDCDFNGEHFGRYLISYQRVTPLAMRELWALSPILRLVLLDQLRRFVARVSAALDARGAADALVDSFMASRASGSAGTAPTLRLPAAPRRDPFVVQLTERLRLLGEEGRPMLMQLATELQPWGVTLDDIVQGEHSRRSSSNHSVRKIVTSLRSAEAFDWRHFFERVSPVERILHVSDSYRACDYRTRDRYRHCIEELARGDAPAELAIAARVLQQLEVPAPTSPVARKDIGDLLIGARRAELEAVVGYRPTRTQRLKRYFARNASYLYPAGVVGAAAGLTFAATALGLPGADWRTPYPWVLSALALFSASALSVGLINRIWMYYFPPRYLPRLSLESGLPATLKTLVVMPVLLREIRDVERYVEALHVHAIANPDSQLRFALLSDGVDAQHAVLAADADLLDAARAAIAALNAADPSPPENEPRYYLLHRRRQWNRHEGCFMGWERKRGKLMELNRLLLGRGPTSFMTSSDEVAQVPTGIQYVLTLDADTRTPLGVVRDLVGVAAHPLNRPVFDAVSGCTLQGYGVLQPRITPLLPSSDERSLYREIVTGGSGIDPYEAAASDLYQDVFGEGLFTGKGLYDVQAFEFAMGERVPENTLLSHDLLEGLFVRCALVNDISLFEDFPSHSEVAASRTHRWTRGDWQLLPWICGRRGPLPPLGRWKMLDNLRRSMMPLAAAALLVTAWSVPGTRQSVWYGVVLLPWLWPALFNALARIACRPVSRSRLNHARQLITELVEDVARAIVSLALLAQNAWVSLDAIGRALIRQFVTHRHRLEWTTAAQVKESAGGSLTGFIWPMKGASIVVLASFACVIWFNPAALPHAAPMLVIWWLSPLLARYLSRPLGTPTAPASITGPALDELRGVARRTWRFFETFVTADEHYLPPDNYQEVPVPVVAHRTSPTNCGLYLLACVSARDFGWIGLEDLVDRISKTLDTLEGLPTVRGHLLNWYDTRTLQPLEPRYVSTVDSGNYVGHLLAVSAALEGLASGPLRNPATWIGPLDSLRACAESARTVQSVSTDDAALLADLQQALVSLLGQLTTAPAALGSDTNACSARIVMTTRIEDIATALAADHTPERQSLLDWAAALHRDMQAQQRDVDLCLSSTMTESTQQLRKRLTTLARRLRRLADQTEFGFLFDRDCGLFFIGYRVRDDAPDTGHYDLLASEARLASLIAIAKGEIPRSHWFKLGRRLTGGSQHATLASWSGSMFEYLMPTLVLREPQGSLLHQTNLNAVHHQIEFGTRHRLPWGVSESGYNVRDREATYQYSAFGLAALGLKRGLGAERVVAPYATALASAFEPVRAAANFRALLEHGGRGHYGFYEAIDFTAGRVPEGQDCVVVRSFMAHHQAMSIVAIANATGGSMMQQRFHSVPMIRAAELLLQERAVRFADAPEMIDAEIAASRAEPPEVERQVEGAFSPMPVTHLLSNRHYSVMITDSGAGYSRYRGLAVTRWREDSTRDAAGSHVYLRDTASGKHWSAGYQPAGGSPQEYSATFREERAIIRRLEGDIVSTLEVIVATDDAAELRRVTLYNQGPVDREVELTSYAEIVLAPHRADLAHPAFSNLFVQTEFDATSGALLAHRRPRSSAEAPIWATHVVSMTAPSHVEYETDRARFLGRGRNPRAAIAIETGRPLSNTTGAVLDPVFSLRTRVAVAAGATISVTFSTIVSESRTRALALAMKYRHPGIFENVAELAWTFARAELHSLQSDLSEARLFQTLAGNLLFASRELRAGSDAIAASRLDVSQLWRFSISGDRPILLILCRSAEELGFVRQCLRAQEYLRIKSFDIDVVILNELQHSYTQDLQNDIERAVRAHATTGPDGASEQRGSVHVLRSDQMNGAERELLVALARVVLQPAQGSLAEQLRRPSSAPGSVPPLWSASRGEGTTHAAQMRPTPEREFFNGLGGFAADGREYVITLDANRSTPAPWCNVLANPLLGTLVTERGAMCTWSLNSRENQITPWSNDAVSDPSGEALYIVDQDSKAAWSPTAQPIRHPEASYEVRHGQGYSRFLTHAEGIASELLVFVAPDDPVKHAVLTVTNDSSRRRRLTIATYVEWNLGPGRGSGASSVATDIDTRTGAMLARNAAQIDFGSRVSFCDLGGRQQQWTASRREFIGRNGDLAAPAGLPRTAEWSRRIGAGFDTCCAFAVTVELEPGAADQIVLTLGQADSEAAATSLVLRARERDPLQVLAVVTRRWDALLGAIHIHTPDRALDVLFNRWLLYQTVASRIRARAGFYQAGGAYGFRDQLQDGMALSFTAPALTREHLLRAAARQFRAGDVQHWWHPPSGRGVRTRSSDDRLWLPYAVQQYVGTSNDGEVLDELLPFLEGPEIPPGREDAHYVPTQSAETATLYEHCALAIDTSLRVGAHRLPLIGGGDWNDGMNRVGLEGRGESVWLAWFLVDTIRRFAPLAEQRGDSRRVALWRAHADALEAACENAGWDGAWYRRGYFDDGTPLGSADNAECRIDSLAQSWAVLAGAAATARARRAMNSVDEYLVRGGDGLVLLFTPPFDCSIPDPGYIKGYLPGLRENGGQYTHAAIWVLMAHARLGNRTQVGALLDMLNPIRRTDSRSGMQAYRVEPYVIAADIYSCAPNNRRGGWTWYTGAAGWFHQAILESVLGVRIRGHSLTVTPCMPLHWSRFEVALTRPGIDYVIRVERLVAAGSTGVELDGVACADGVVPLRADGAPHVVRVLVS